MRFSILSSSCIRTICENYYLSNSINKINRNTSIDNIRRNFRSVASPFARSNVKGNLYMENLPVRNLPEQFIKIEAGDNPAVALQDKITKWSSNKSMMRANEQVYIESFRMMINFEEAAEVIQKEKCNQENIKLHHIDGNEFFFYLTPEMTDLSIYTKQFDRFVLRSNDASIALDGTIILKENNRICVELSGDIDWHEDLLFDIVFTCNRNFYLLQHQALNIIQNHKLFDLLINNPHYSSPAVDHQETEKIKNEQNKSTFDDLNEEQIEAVEKIVQGRYYPLPYLLYGPPGTGKTKTLVAAIKNIMRTSDKNILVCTQSNAACDEITNRLQGFLNRKEMFRLYSKSKDLDVISPSVKMFSNLFNGDLKYPPLDYIYKYRIVICTLATAGCLTRAECDPDHFSYVIIDECASALETMAMVPIAGLCTSVGKVHANIVLAGDPKQLDAVIKSEWATKLGFGTSWLEQLFKFPLYKRNASTGKFNSNYITQLVKNYRSHPSILQVPNQMFYDGVLEAKSFPDIKDLNITFPQMNPDSAVIFKSVQGLCIKPENDTSSFNVDEIVHVMDFLQLLLKNNEYLKQSDIGIVSPYRLQCEMIRMTCKSHKLNEITVGTAETFQGQERKIIIASTVCSGNGSLSSFVSDPQRLNVMATRAQYLLIIIGDPHTLKEDLNWSVFINYCYQMGNLIQSDNHFDPIEVENNR